MRRSLRLSASCRRSVRLRRLRALHARPRPLGASVLLLGVIIAASLAHPASGAGDAETAAFFRQNCASCHTIGSGRLTGPDLKGVLERRDRPWLERFVRNPRAVLDAGDSYAARLVADARGVIMPAVPGLTPERTGRLLDLIAVESKLEKSQFAGPAIDDRPFTAADVATGRNLFIGATQLAAGGPSCISCHSIPAAPGLGGGALGPDLTKVFERLEGRTGMSAWLQAPATPTMQAVFRQHPLDPAEIRPLVALFQDAAQSGAPPRGPDTQFVFGTLGMGGTALLLLLFGHVWRKRFRAVRRPMVESQSAWGES